MCFTENSGERGQRLSGVEHRVVSDKAATDGGGVVCARMMLAEASVGMGLRTGREEFTQRCIMTGERLVGSAALPNGAVWVSSSGRRSCGRSGGGA